jgi:hypothetical protein
MISNEYVAEGIRLMDELYNERRKQSACIPLPGVLKIKKEVGYESRSCIVTVFDVLDNR